MCTPNDLLIIVLAEEGRGETSGLLQLPLNTSSKLLRLHKLLYGVTHSKIFSRIEEGLYAAGKSNFSALPPPV